MRFVGTYNQARILQTRQCDHNRNRNGLYSETRRHSAVIFWERWYLHDLTEDAGRSVTTSGHESFINESFWGRFGILSVANIKMRRLAAGDSEDITRIHHEIRWPCGTQLRRRCFTEFVGWKGDIRAMCLTYSICRWTRSVSDVSDDTKLLTRCHYIFTTLLSPAMSPTPSHFFIIQTNLYHFLFITRHSITKLSD